MNFHNIDAPNPQENGAGSMLIAYCSGNHTDTELETKVYTWEQFALRMSKPTEGGKYGSYIIRGGKLLKPKRGDGNLLEAELFVIDGDSSFDPETGEVFTGIDDDEPNPEKKVKGSCVPIEVAAAALGRLGYKYVIHTTHTHTPGVLNKWRAYIPAKMANKDELVAVANYVIAQLRGGGCYVELVSEMTVMEQPWFLPRVKPKYRGSFVHSASLVGKTIDVQAAVSWYAAEQQRNAAEDHAEPAAPRAEYSGTKFISDFNSKATEGDFQRLLLGTGLYTFAGRSGSKLRFMAKTSETKTPGVSVFRSRKGGDLMACSHHGAHDPLSGGGGMTFFDLVALFTYGGDQKRAFEHVKREAGAWTEAGSGKVNSDEFAKEPGEASADDGLAATLRAVWNPWREHAVPAFPMDVLPPDVARYVEARAIETGACGSAIAMCVLTASSAAITHEAKAYLKPGKHFPVSPRLWSAIIGPPSAKKSPAIDGAVSPLILSQKQIQAAQWRSWKEQQEEDGKKRNSRPELTKYTDNDMTPEGLVDTLAYQPRGLLVVADELSGFLTSFDRYGAGKGASAGRAVWLQAYNGGYYAATRSSRIVPPVENLSVSVLGGIQAERLKELGGLTSDGLLQRFLPVWMSKPALDSNSFDHNAWRGWRDRTEGLLTIGKFSTELVSEAQKDRQRIAEFLFNLGQVESEGAAWQGFVGKLPGVWGSLALIMHCLWEPQVGTGIKGENAKRASRLVEDFLLPHGLAFYREIAGGSQADNRNIAGFLAGWTEPTIKARDFVRGPRCCRGVGPDSIWKQLQPFEAGGWLLPVHLGMANREWKIRPRLAEMFAAELEKHRTALAAVQDKIRGFSDD